MSADNKEERLRSDLYTALVELTNAAAHEKPAIVERLSEICKQLRQVVTRGNLPRKQR
jgi:hypothetical protein